MDELRADSLLCDEDGVCIAPPELRLDNRSKPPSQHLE